MNNMHAEKEEKLHSTAYIPFTYYKCVIPVYYFAVPLHWHSEFEINYILSGEGVFQVGDKSAILKSEDVAVVLPNMPHSISQNGSEKLIYDTIVFNRSLICESNSDRIYCEYLYPLLSADSNIDLPVSVNNPYFKEIQAITENIFAHAKGDSGKSDLLLKSEIIRLFWLIIEGGSLHSNAERKTVFNEDIRAVIEYIQSSYSDDITVELLARKAHFSKSYFMNVFKRLTGVSAMDYLDQVRIKAACEMLIATNQTSAETSIAVGYGNISNFNRHFRKRVGCSPQEYRRKRDK